LVDAFWSFWSFFSEVAPYKLQKKTPDKYFVNERISFGLVRSNLPLVAMQQHKMTSFHQHFKNEEADDQQLFHLSFGWLDRFSESRFSRL
jgi:hypothetical protein